MYKEYIRLKYDGSALAEHSIEVSSLAPALLAIEDLCKQANQHFNDNRASIKILVNAELKQECFQLNLELVQTIVNSTQLILNPDNITSTKELLTWLGISTGTVGYGVGLFEFLKWLRNRTITSKKTVTQTNGKDIIQITVKGSNNSINVYPQTIELAEKTQSITGFKKIVKPLTNEGYDNVEFRYEDSTTGKINKEEAKDILAMTTDIMPDTLIESSPQIVKAWINVYSPVYDKTSPRWRFTYNEQHEYIDISETNIAEKALERGGALKNDTYLVELQITQIKKPDGGFKNHYKIISVLNFRPATLKQQIWTSPALVDTFDGTIANKRRCVYVQSEVFRRV